MKLFCISDNIDTIVGLRLAGIEGIVLHEKTEIENELDEIEKDDTIGIIIMTEKVVNMVKERISKIRNEGKFPLIVEIPDRHGTYSAASNITDYIREAVGIKL